MFNGLNLRKDVKNIPSSRNNIVPKETVCSSLKIDCAKYYLYRCTVYFVVDLSNIPTNAVDVLVVPYSVRLPTPYGTTSTWTACLKRKAYDSRTTHDTLPQHQINITKSLSVLNSKLSKEQSKLPEDDSMIETCRSVLSVLM